MLVISLIIIFDFVQFLSEIMPGKKKGKSKGKKKGTKGKKGTKKASTVQKPSDPFQKNEILPPLKPGEKVQKIPAGYNILVSVIYIDIVNIY